MIGGRTNSPKPDDGKNTAGQDDEVAEIVAEWHASENRERSVKLFQVSPVQVNRFFQACAQLTMAPILPLTVMTIPMIALPRTQAPIASFQLRPTAMMEEAAQPYQNRRSLTRTTDRIARDSPTSQFETAQASAIQ